MIWFWIVAVLLLAAALAFLLPALLTRKASATPAVGGANVAVYRDQLREAERDLAAGLVTPERFAQTRNEIERRVLEDTAAAAADTTAVRPSRVTAVVLAVLIPAASVLTYRAIGNPAGLSPPSAAAPAGSQHEVTAEQIERMVADLAERLQSQPDDVQGWLMLGRSYAALSRHADAVAALRKAVAAQPRNADVLADLADMVGMVQGRKLAGEPLRLVQQALDIEPRHVKALALAGSAALEAGDLAAARGHWERLLAVVPPESEVAGSIRDGLAEVARRAGTAASTPVAAAAPGAERISGEVRLDPQLASRVAKGDTVFVYARAVEGPRAPLAIVRARAEELPLRFSLDDSSAMSPQARLSNAGQVMIEARVSKSGQATPQSGDLAGAHGPVAPGSSGLTIVIGRVLP